MTVLTCLGITIGAQNLVRNPSMEESAECPLVSFDFFFEGPCTDWTSPNTGTPDYYHSICSFPGSGTTTNNSKPQDGQAFLGFYSYGRFTNFYNREYVQGALNKPLVPGHTYYVSFWIKPVNADAAGISYALQDIGIYFSETYPAQNSELLIPVNPQVVHTKGPISDLNAWTQVTGCFTATSTATLFTIGNFYKDEDCKVTPLKGAVKSQFAYNLLDNVEVVEIASEPLITEQFKTICASDSLRISANKGVFTSLLWNDGDTNSSKWLKNSGTYILTANYQNTCTVSDTVKIATENCNTCQFYAPDAFTPDDNGRNEKFSLQSNCSPELVRLQIYTRWGEKILDITSKNPVWDGKFNGEYLPEGSFIYAFDIYYKEKGTVLRKNKNGVVTILR